MKKYRGIHYQIEKTGNRYQGTVYYNGTCTALEPSYFYDVAKALVFSKIVFLKALEKKLS